MLFLVNENEEEEVEVGAKSNYKSLMILEEVGLFFFGCVKECFFAYYYLFYLFIYFIFGFTLLPVLVLSHRSFWRFSLRQDHHLNLGLIAFWVPQKRWLRWLLWVLRSDCLC